MTVYCFVFPTRNLKRNGGIYSLESGRLLNFGGS